MKPQRDQGAGVRATLELFIGCRINCQVLIMSKQLICSLVLLTAISTSGYSLDATVVTKSGPVKGAGVDVISFKGIPYAAAPVGRLRWRPAEDPHCGR